MEYFEKVENNSYEDLYWNIPEKKQGIVNVVGGNGQSFRAEVKTAEFLINRYPLEVVNTVLPESLKDKLPLVENFKFLPATENGAFNGEGLLRALNEVDFNLIVGDLSKNIVTGRAVASALAASEKLTLITRDTIDLISENQPEDILLNEKMIIFGSLAQMQKLLRAVYYPKMLLLSQSLVQVVEVLHKFTLSYPLGIITLHNGQILVAKDGVVKAVSVEKSGYSPIMLWSGELAAKIVVLNLYNPNNFVDATIAATLS